MRRFTAGTAIVMGLVALGARPATSQLVANGGFELGNSGWTFNRNDCPASAPLGDPTSAPIATGAWGALAHTGSSELWFGAMGCTPSISQTLFTIPGQQYLLNFWYEAYGAQGGAGGDPWNNLAAVVGGTTLFSSELTNPTWQEASVAFTGTGSDVLEFAGFNLPGGDLLDDVSVSAVTVVTPEPAAMTMLGLGLVGLAGAGLGKKRN